jgi:uncharacterized protein (TIGR00730 family)
MTTQKEPIRVCVFCAAKTPDDTYIKPTKELGALLGKGGHTLVWGGTATGLMGAIAEEATRFGAKTSGISIRHLHHEAYQHAHEMVVAKTLSERKTLMLERSDIFVILPGGMGTLDELSEILELKKHGFHNKPIIILNTKGFYNGLKAQLSTMEVEGFLRQPLRQLANFVSTPAQVIREIEVYRGSSSA